jgi:hypothetical protein
MAVEKMRQGQEARGDLALGRILFHSSSGYKTLDY